MKKIKIFILFMICMSVSTFAYATAKQSLENFVDTSNYQDGQFTDVSNDAWFADSVKNAYNLNLMKGTTETYFNANSNISIAETIVLATRLHSIYYYGEESFEQGDIWYKTYVDYALQNGIITEEFKDYSKLATRGEFAYILSKALPDVALKSKNSIEDESIPDITKNDYYYNDVYKLYKAGILTGNDENGTFAPYSNIDRASVAAIVSRMAKEKYRKDFKLKKKAYFPLEIVGAKYGVDILGDLKVYLTVKNNGPVAIDAYTFKALLFDAYTDPVYYLDYGSNEYTGLWNNPRNKAIMPYSNSTDNCYWSLFGYTGVKKLKIALVKCHTVDGQTYELNKEDYVWKPYSY